MGEYTKEQIDEIKTRNKYLSDLVKTWGASRENLSGGSPADGIEGPDLSEGEIDIALLLSAMSTVEQERDTLKDQLKKYEWALAETEALVISHEGHIAKLEAKLQGATDAAAYAEFNTLLTDMVEQAHKEVEG